MTTVVDARGVLCPVPIIRLARAAATLPAGSLLVLLSDDPAAQHDVPAWCRLRGHELLGTEVLEPDEPAPGAGAPPGRPTVGATPDEPSVPNPNGGPVYRHLIRLGDAAASR